MRFFGHRRWLYGLRHNVFTLSTDIVQFLLRGPRGQPGVNPYRDCAQIVRKSQSPQPPHVNRTEPVRGSAFARWACGDCAMPPTTCLRATVLRFFQICKNFSLNQIVDAAEPVNPYENLTADSCLRREASRRPHGKGDTGRIRAP